MRNIITNINYLVQTVMEYEKERLTQGLASVPTACEEWLLQSHYYLRKGCLLPLTECPYFEGLEDFEPPNRENIMVNNHSGMKCLFLFRYI